MCIKIAKQLSFPLFLLCLSLVLICPSTQPTKDINTDSEKKNGAMVAMDTDEDNDEETVSVSVTEQPDLDFSKEIDPSAGVFYPTKDWQTVKKGQAIPRGLHVRMNFETHQVEAKLMDGDDGMKYWKQGEKEGMINTNKKSFSREELKQALKTFKANRDDVQDVKMKEESLKKKFRSYDELKSDFQKMNMDVKTDIEIITNLLEVYQNASLSVEDKKNVLTDLEFYLHQIDNARDFADMGGLDLVIRDLNNTDSEIRSEAAFVVGAAVQSNPRVQIKAIEAGALQHLIRMLSTEKIKSLKSRVVYALSSLLRHFPYAQQKFLQLGGLTAVTSLFSDSDLERLQIKAITLTYDILLEQENVIKNANLNDSQEKEKLRQYKNVKLREAMIELGWCDHIRSLLSVQEHDAREKVFHAMEMLVEACRPNFQRSLDTLVNLQQEYEKLSGEELEDGEVDDYFQGVYSSISQIISNLDNYSPPKEEL